MLAIVTATKDPQKYLGFLRRRRQGCYSNCRRANKNNVPYEACGKKRIASKSDRRGGSPHRTQYLQHVMSRGDVGYFAKRAYLMIEDKIPRECDILPNIKKYKYGPLIKLCDDSTTFPKRNMSCSCLERHFSTSASNHHPVEIANFFGTEIVKPINIHSTIKEISDGIKF